MIIYSSTKQGFISDVFNDTIDNKIHASFVRELGHDTGRRELESWRNSMPYMSKVIDDPSIPDNAGVAVEYKIPQTSKRIDFIITGLDADKKKAAVIVELKQWSEAKLTNMDGIVNTVVGGGYRDVSHPSYQVWSYATLLEDYNDAIQKEKIKIVPCAYLHNYEKDEVISHSFYKHYTDKAPVYFKHEAQILRDFIKTFVKYGDDKQILYEIDKGKISPSKILVDNLISMMQGNQEFIMIDDQKIVFEHAKNLANTSTADNKHVVIVEGGPGTGKTVVAINLLTELTKCKQVAAYVTKNSAPRLVYEIKLSGKFTKTRISNLFKSSGSFYDVAPNTFDTLIVDEAHRLNEKSGLFSNKGENQIKELIRSSKCSIFFVDEDQRVTVKDIGDKQSIQKWAQEMNAKVHNLALASQFRCNGSDGYIAWIDNTLQIKETANESLSDTNYDFRVIDSPQELHDIILSLNGNNKARVVAGYCWKWVSKNKPELKDISIGNYHATWNLSTQGQAWIIYPDSAREVGCIHTCQGLELDYVGVIIGPDMVVRNGKVVTDFKKRASTDQSIKGLKQLEKQNKEYANKLADTIIKNTYRTLLTRGIKGCFIYCTDQETQAYFKAKIGLQLSQENIYSDISTGENVITENDEKYDAARTSAETTR